MFPAIVLRELGVTPLLCTKTPTELLPLITSFPSLASLIPSPSVPIVLSFPMNI